jgi:hypothetical protein
LRKGLNHTFIIASVRDGTEAHEAGDTGEPVKAEKVRQPFLTYGAVLEV